MLDYTILLKDPKNFIKNTSVENIVEVVEEIINILKDKVEMKNIQLKTKFIGFNDSIFKELVAVDVKRIQ